MPLICTKHDSKNQGDSTKQAKHTVSSWNLPGCQDIQVNIQTQHDVVSLLQWNLPDNTGDSGWIPGSGRCPGEGNGNALQYCCLGNPTDRGPWQATVHGIVKSWTQLNN